MSDDFVSEIEHLSPLGDHCTLKFNANIYLEQTEYRNKSKLNKGQYHKLNEYLDTDWDDYLDPADSTVDEMLDKYLSC